MVTSCRLCGVVDRILVGQCVNACTLPAMLGQRVNVHCQRCLIELTKPTPGSVECWCHVVVCCVLVERDCVDNDET